jgi:phenylacetate-CoA oxygenase PaaH subunit
MARAHRPAADPAREADPTPASDPAPDADRDHVAVDGPTFEVFGRRRVEDPLEHVGTLHAPDETTALLLARETHFRHQEGVDYAVVRSEHLHRVPDPSLLERRIDISYRLQAGYAGFREKRHAAREAADARGRGHLRERPVPGRHDSGGRHDLRGER